MRCTFAFDGKVKGQGRPRFARGHAYEAPEDRQYKEYLARLYREQGGLWFGSLPVCVTIDVMRAIPKSYPLYRDNEPDVLKPDVDNVAKAVLDALCGVAFADDAQVVTLIVRKHKRWRRDSGNDRMRVTVSTVDKETIYPHVYEV